MKIERLLADVNLSDIAFPESSSNVVLSFLNMSDGGAVGSLVCNGLVVFAYQTAPGSGLPQYVGEVNHALVSGDGASALLQRLRYDFKDSRGGALIPDAVQIHHVCIEGGVSIEIVCAEVRLVR
jgi:hypothetical protein